MLFTYQYIHHNIEKLHQYIEDLVLNVWCTASGNFSQTKLQKDFRLIVKKNDKYLGTPIKEIYLLFAKLSPLNKKKIAQGFVRNNDIMGICNGTILPFRYSDMALIDSGLSNKVNTFFKNLYSEVLKQSAVKKECGDLDEHYDMFMISNANGKCAFCGLTDLKSDLLSKRDAYDHYLPKDLYPFNSVNFKNLLPCCNTCNSSYKGVKDPVFDKSNNLRRKAFFPFAVVKPEIKFAVIVKFLDFNDPKLNDVAIKLKSVKSQEEVDAWIDVYGIKERYLDKCKSEDSKYWVTQLTELKNYGIDPQKFFPNYIAARKNQPQYLEYNFIRIPFLESCFTTGYIK